MRVYNIGRSFVITGIVELILSSLFYSSKHILSTILGNYSYFCLLFGVIIIILSFKIDKLQNKAK
jgi:hypothetical protein